uniref:C6 domain-containing protein n=1 Tax=Plectus sambesii TaxID=2011161 RepID=A0A914XHE2_9BILA
MDARKGISALSIVKKSTAAGAILLLLLSFDKITTPVEACVATVTTPTVTTCADPSTLFEEFDDATLSLDTTGTQAVGTKVVATCEGQDTMFIVTYDDGTIGRQDQDPTPGNKEEVLTLRCTTDGSWSTKTVDEYSVSDSPVRTSGTVTDDVSITCEPYVKQD